MTINKLALTRIWRKTRTGCCLSLVALTAIVSLLLGSPVWAPEDPWRLVAEIPIVRGPERTGVEEVADFLEEHGIRLHAGQLFAIAESVAEESRRHGIDTELLMSVIFSESGFRVDAVSEKGAIGLMQLLPSTAEEIADQLNLRWQGDAHLLNPQANIALGSYYLRQLMDLFDDDLELALTAYNKGPGYVHRLRALAAAEPGSAAISSAYAEKIVGLASNRTRTRAAL